MIGGALPRSVLFCSSFRRRALVSVGAPDSDTGLAEFAPSNPTQLIVTGRTRTRRVAVPSAVMMQYPQLPHG